MTLSRMCIISRVRLPRNEMIKITRVKNEWLVDEEQKLFGRSIYFVLNAENIKKFEKQKKRFKMSDELYKLCANSVRCFHGNDVNLYQNC